VTDGDPGQRQRRAALPQSRFPGHDLTRYLLAGLLILIAIAGLRATSTAVSWHGPLRGEGFDLAIAVEVILAILFLVVRWLDRRHARPGPLGARLRIQLRWSIGAVMTAVVCLMLAGLVGLPYEKTHINPLELHVQPLRQRRFPLLPHGHSHGSAGAELWVVAVVLFILVVVIPLLMGLTLLAVRRRRRRLQAGGAAGWQAESAASLIEAVDSARRALRSVDDAQAAIIACYLAMESSLAGAGATRAQAETPAELLTRAQDSGLLRGPAAATLTQLFYVARFSTKPLPPAARAEALQALDMISAELSRPAAAESAVSGAPA
jgi:hypothetical protein